MRRKASADRHSWNNSERGKSYTSWQAIAAHSYEAQHWLTHDALVALVDSNLLGAVLHLHRKVCVKGRCRLFGGIAHKTVPRQAQLRAGKRKKSSNPPAAGASRARWGPQPSWRWHQTHRLRNKAIARMRRMVGRTKRYEWQQQGCRAESRGGARNN